MPNYLSIQCVEGILRSTFETIRRNTNTQPKHIFYLIFDCTFQEKFIFYSNIKPLIYSSQDHNPSLNPTSSEKAN
jgi:hypothetical protein